MTKDNYTPTWCEAARKCRPTEDWHWRIMARDYQTEYSVVRRAFKGKLLDSALVGGYDIALDERVRRAFVGKFLDKALVGGYDIALDKRGATWGEVGRGARKIAAAIAKRFVEHGRPLPYVNTLWLVIAEKDFA